MLHVAEPECRRPSERLRRLGQGAGASAGAIRRIRPPRIRLSWDSVPAAVRPTFEAGLLALVLPLEAAMLACGRD